MNPAPITFERAHELFTYDAGVLRWKCKASRNTVIGSAAGCRNKGYILVRADGRLYGAHRIVWLMLNGSLPAMDVDHINHHTDDNRIENLRLASRAENMQNVLGPQRNNKSGFLGVSWCRQRRKWIAQLRAAGRWIYCGHHTSPEDAHAAYLQAKRVHHPFQTIAP